jgi:uncharacterized membrane protein
MNGHFDWHAVYTNDGFRRILIGDKFGRIYLVNLGRFFGLGNCVHIFVVTHLLARTCCT